MDIITKDEIRDMGQRVNSDATAKLYIDFLSLMDESKEVEARFARHYFDYLTK
jgi:hypothetical protein